MSFKIEHQSCKHVFDTDHENDIVVYSDDYVGVHIDGMFYNCYAPGIYSEMNKDREAAVPQFELEAVQTETKSTLDSGVLTALLSNTDVEGVIKLREAGLI